MTDEKLRTIERAEQALRALGFRVCRVRHHDDLARIEIGRDEMRARARARDRARRSSRELKAVGYRYVTLDLQGYRTGQPERRTAPAAGVTRVRPRLARRVLAAPALFLALHLPFLPPSLEDLDSINFALGVRDFDVAQHQPHPPGYPLFIAAAKARCTLLGLSEVHALSLLSVVAGGARRSSRCSCCSRGSIAIGGRRRSTVAGRAARRRRRPLFWFTAARPLSDMAGLAAALAVQALIADARRRARRADVAAFLRGVRAPASARRWCG